MVQVVENKSALRWVIRYSDDTIKMAACRHIGLRDGVLAAKSNKFLNLEIEGD